MKEVNEEPKPTKQEQIWALNLERQIEFEAKRQRKVGKDEKIASPLESEGLQLKGWTVEAMFINDDGVKVHKLKKPKEG